MHYGKYVKYVYNTAFSTVFSPLYLTRNVYKPKMLVYLALNESHMKLNLTSGWMLPKQFCWLVQWIFGRWLLSSAIKVKSYDFFHPASHEYVHSFIIYWFNLFKVNNQRKYFCILINTGHAELVTFTHCFDWCFFLSTIGPRFIRSTKSAHETCWIRLYIVKKLHNVFSYWFLLKMYHYLSSEMNKALIFLNVFLDNLTMVAGFNYRLSCLFYFAWIVEYWPPSKIGVALGACRKFLHLAWGP